MNIHNSLILTFFMSFLELSNDDSSSDESNDDTNDDISLEENTHNVRSTEQGKVTMDTAAQPSLEGNTQDVRSTEQGEVTMDAPAQPSLVENTQDASGFKILNCKYCFSGNQLICYQEDELMEQEFNEFSWFYHELVNSFCVLCCHECHTSSKEKEMQFAFVTKMNTEDMPTSVKTIVDGIIILFVEETIWKIGAKEKLINLAQSLQPLRQSSQFQFQDQSLQTLRKNKLFVIQYYLYHYYHPSQELARVLLL